MNFSDLVDRYQSVLAYHLPLKEKKRKTILDIGGYPHYENVLSNFYKFYFDKNEEHRFKDLFIKSINKIIKLKSSIDLNLEEYEVWTEESTNKGGRIDLLIKETDNSKVIIIENKVNHILLNNLEDYWESVSCTTNQKVGVLLTIKVEKPSHPKFINITHTELIKQVEQNIGAYISNADDKHLLFFKDFTQNIKNISTKMTYNNERTIFFFENMKKVEELYDLREECRSHYLEAIKLAAQELAFKLENTNPKYYRCLIINKKPNFRFWIKMNFSEPSKCFEIYLEVFGDSMKQIQNIINNTSVKEEASIQSIEIDVWDEEKNGIAFAYKNYPLDATKFQNLSSTIVDMINNDWKKFSEICIASCK